MAEATGLRNNALPYPVYGVPYGVVFPLLDEDGDLVAGGGSDTPDSEVSLNGDTFADCTNELTEIATTSGMYYLLLTAAEMVADVVALICKVATATTQTTPIVLYPRKLPQIRTGTAQAGAAGTITLDASASAVDDHYNGCLVYLNGGTGSGQARVIADYVGSTKVASVTPNWATNPDVTSTFIVYLPEGRFVSDVNVKAVSDDAAAADNLELDYDGTGYAKANSTIGTCTTNTDMRGTDAAAPASTALSNAVWTDDKASYIPAGLMPTQAEVLAIQNNTRVRVIVPPAIERPDAGSTTYRLWLYLYDTAGNMEAPDSLPTITAQNNTGTDRSSGLSAVTNPSTGVYYADYTVANTHAIEGLLFQWSVVEGGVTRTHGAQALVVDTTAVDFTSADRTKLEGVYNKLPSRDYLAGSAAATGETQTDAAAALNAYDPPTNTEFEARTLAAASYFDPAADTVTNVTTVGSVTTKTGYALAATGADLITSAAIFAEAIADAVLARSVANVETTAAEWSLCTVILAMLESSISGTTWTIKRTDGTTTHKTKTVTTDAAADPITGVT